MYKMIFLLGFLQVFLIAQCMEVIPLRPEIKYVNSKYIETFKVNIQRHSRGTPYYINFTIKTLFGVGNNVTMAFILYEYLSGNYVPLAINYKEKLCDFLYKDPILGQMWMKQLPKNLTSCPYSRGYYVVKDILIHLENLPFRIPFTFSAIDVTSRCDITMSHTDTEELLIDLKVHLRLIQKPKYKVKKQN